MKRYVQVFLMAIAFDLYWALVVLFRERGLFMWLGLAILAWALLSPGYRFYAFVLAAAGCSLDALWAFTGLLDFQGDALLPLWMVALWLMFAVMWTGMTCLSTLPGWMLALLATSGGPMAYVIGERLGAMTFLQPTFIVVSWMASGWLLLMLFFHFLMGRRQ